MINEMTTNKNVINQLSKEAQNQFRNSLLGFEKTLTPMQAGRAEKTLHKLFNTDSLGVVTEKELIFRRITESGAKPKKEENYQYLKRNRELSKPKTLYMLFFTSSYHAGEKHDVFNEISKTGYDFANYLINNNLTDLVTLEAYLIGEIEAEQDEERKAKEAEEQVKKQAEQEVKKKQDYESWINREIESFDNGDLLEKACNVFGSKMPEGFNVNEYQVKRLITLLDNIDHPMALDELKSRLHSHNKGSKAVVSFITGAMLPSTDKGTMSILDGLHEKRIQEKKDQNRIKSNKEWVQVTDDVAVSIQERKDGLFDVAVMTSWFGQKWKIEEDYVQAKEALTSMQVYGYIEHEVKPAYVKTE